MQSAFYYLRVTKQISAAEQRDETLNAVVAKRTTTLRARRLALVLRDLRISSGLSLEESAAELGVHATTLSRMERGESFAKPANVATLCQIYGVPPDKAAELFRLAKEARQRGWWHDYASVLSQAYNAYIAFESEASSVRNYETLLVPGLLQTEDYARTVIAAMLPDASSEDVDTAVAVRMKRQDRLVESAPLKFWAVIHESALLMPTGGQAVMRHQLEHVAETATKLRNVTVQVLPISVGAHAGMSGSFSLLSFPGADDQDVAYVDGPAGEVYPEEPEEVERLALVYDHIRAASLSVPASIERVRQLMKESP